MYSYQAFRFGMIFAFALSFTLLGSLPSSQAPLPQPSFATPPLYSVASSEVGLTGMFSMAKGDFNGDGQSADLYGRHQHLGRWRGDANWAGISAGDRDDCRRQ